MSITSTNYKFPKRYFKYVNLFLKEVGLYSEWKRFLNMPSEGVRYGNFRGRHTDWMGYRDYSLVNVLGKTNFTTFLQECCHKPLPSDVCSYELFAAFLYKFYPKLVNNQDDMNAAMAGMKYLHIDKDKKKVSILW